MKRILVTGGAGFIGSRLVHALIRGDPAREVLIYDNLHPQVHGNHPETPDWGRQARLVQGDVRDRDALFRAIAEINPDTVYHLAAETGTGQSKDSMAHYCEVNVTGTANLLEAVRLHARELGRVILAGSRAVYGEGAYRNRSGDIVVPSERIGDRIRAGLFDVVDADGHPLSPVPTPEDVRPSPASVYGSTKLMQEFLLTHEAGNSSWRPVILRFQNVYGPGQSLKNPYTGVLSIFCSQILSGIKLDLYEDGLIVRDFVFVDDVVDSLVRAGTAQRHVPMPVNIGSGAAATILQVAKTLLDLHGGGNGYQISGRYRPGDIRHAVADITLAREMLGWTPHTDLHSGLRSLAEWAVRNRPAT